MPGWRPVIRGHAAAVFPETRPAYRLRLPPFDASRVARESGRGTESGDSTSYPQPAAVKTLVECVSLFPVGSAIQLNDGRVGRSIRTNYESYSSPVVEVWRVGQSEEPPEIIDLRGKSERIVSVFAGKTGPAIRVTPL